MQTGKPVAGQHHRRIQRRQWLRVDDVAGRRLCAIPWREGNDVGRWGPRAVFGSLARTYQAGHGNETASSNEDLYVTLAGWHPSTAELRELLAWLSDSE